MTRFWAAFAILLSLAACTPRGQIVIAPDAAKTGMTETVFIGTTRAPDPETGEEFGALRAQKARFARLDIAIPPDRTTGTITWPRAGRPPDAATEFLATRQVTYQGEPAFRADLSRTLAARPKGRREVIVFVHGFNTTFAEGAYRLAQLGHDLGVDATLVHYSWPSGGSPLGYAYDRDSALFARDGLEVLLREVSNAGAERITIVAHSLGASLTMETLRQIAISGGRRLAPAKMSVVMISPDIDLDVFRAQALRIGALPVPFVIFTSKRDRILALSARLSGQRNRLGTLTDVRKVADLNVFLLDTTAFSEGAGHFNAGDSPALLSILRRIRDVDTAFSGDPTKRAGLLPGAVLTVQNATEIILTPVSTLSGAVR